MKKKKKHSGCIKQSTYLGDELLDVLVRRQGGLATTPDFLHFRVDRQSRTEGRREQKTLNGSQVRLHTLSSMSILLQLLLDSLQGGSHVLQTYKIDPNNFNKNDSSI
jgi:hypothetical protein